MRGPQLQHLQWLNAHSVFMPTPPLPCQRGSRLRFTQSANIRRVFTGDALEATDSRDCADCAGDALYQTHENLEHLAMMEAVLGPIPEHMALASNSAARKFFVTRCALLSLALHAGRSVLPVMCMLMPRKQ